MRFESKHIAVLVLTNVPRVYQSMSRVNQFTIDGVSFYYRDRIVAVEANALLPMTRDSWPRPRFDCFGRDNRSPSFFMNRSFPHEGCGRFIPISNAQDA